MATSLITFSMTVLFSTALAADSGAKGSAKELPTAPSAEASPATKEATSKDLNTPPQVAPEGVVIPPGRPEWVGRNVTAGSDHSIWVGSGPFSTEAEAYRELDNVLKAGMDDYIATQLGSSLAPQLIRYDVARIKREF